MFCVYMCEVCTCVRCGMQKHGTGGQRAAPHLPRFWALNSGPPACVMSTFSFIYVCVYKHICPCLYGCTHLRVEVRSWPASGVLSFEASSLPKPGLHRLCPMPGAPACLCPSQSCGCKHAENPILLSGCWRLLSGPCLYPECP